jgi:ParB family chromosome partitioning protein
LFFSSIDNLALSLDQPQKGEKITLLSLDKVIPDPDQPRRDRNKEADNELANSIKEEGVIQPIIVRPENDDGYHMIICGERRYDGLL